MDTTRTQHTRMLTMSLLSLEVLRIVWSLGKEHDNKRERYWHAIFDPLLQEANRFDSCFFIRYHFDGHIYSKYFQTRDLDMYYDELDMYARWDSMKNWVKSLMTAALNGPTVSKEAEFFYI